jgi:hypothetical protein
MFSLPFVMMYGFWQQEVAESLDQKYDFQPATDHCFFCLKHGFVITMNSDVILNPQWWQICVINWIKCCLIKVRHLWKSYFQLKICMILAGLRVRGLNLLLPLICSLCSHRQSNSGTYWHYYTYRQLKGWTWEGSLDWVWWRQSPSTNEPGSNVTIVGLLNTVG